MRFIIQLFLVIVANSFLYLYAVNKPNIVIILADDLGIGDISGLNPESKIQTPAIDSLIGEGMVFTDAHSSSSVCTPTRYGLLTGRYSWRTRLKGRVIDSYQPCLIDKDRDTIASLLKRQGYKTAMVGKWHLGLNWTPKQGIESVSEESHVDFTQPITHGPVDVGFDYFYGLGASWDFPPYAFIENRKIPTVPTKEVGGRLVPWPQEYLDAEAKKLPAKEMKKVKARFPVISWRPGLANEGITPTSAVPEITKKAVEYINQQNSESPFFLYMPLTAPHTPVVPSEGFMGKSKMGIYGDFCMEMDDSVRQVIEALKSKGMFDNTLLVFTADNGSSLKACTPADKKKYNHKTSYIYKGFKARLDEGGHRVPFIATWPKTIKAGAKNDSLIGLNDFYATFCEMFGEVKKDEYGEDSYSILNELKGNKTKHPERVIVHRDFSGSLGFRSKGWKIGLKVKDGVTTETLYDLNEDISEEMDLSKSNPEKVKNLKQELAKVIRNGRSTTGEPQENDGPDVWDQITWIKEFK